MRAHWAYLVYVLRHKWFVFLACPEMEVPLWRAIVHDASKFSPVEWTPYVYNFFNPDGTKRNVRDASGAYDPNSQSDAFKRAWPNHQRNLHHWQAWVSIGDRGSLTALPMPETYVREMVADWTGAGRAISGETDPRKWYRANADKMILNGDTRVLVERLLEL